MAKRKIRRQRRIEAANSHTPDATSTDCVADDCAETATTTVEIDGHLYRVCPVHAELVQLQEHRRAAHRRQQDDVDAAERRRQTEAALGIR